MKQSFGDKVSYMGAPFFVFIYSSVAMKKIKNWRKARRTYTLRIILLSKMQHVRRKKKKKQFVLPPRMLSII